MPDEAAQVEAVKYINPRLANWPKADYIVGNPPFIGNKRMRDALGDGYVNTLRGVYKDVPESADYVMYWWDLGAALVGDAKAERVGLITTNSITQSFNSRVVARHVNPDSPVNVALAIPDHPWVDSSDGADVRIAMSVVHRSPATGTVLEIYNEVPGEDGAEITFRRRAGRIGASFDVGFDPTTLARLEANKGLACPGVQLSGQGFLVPAENLSRFAADPSNALIRRYYTGRDLTQEPRTQFVIDTFGLDEDGLRARFPTAYQWLSDRVRPERMQNPREKYKRDWWLPSEPRAKFRGALLGLQRLIVTSRTSRHRTFQFLDSKSLFETKVLVFASDDAFVLGTLSSRAHVLFANRSGGWLGVGNDSTYNHSICFDAFPFPNCSDELKARIRSLGEQLDAHRKRQQAAHPRLTLTDMYNTLEKLRAGEELSEKDQRVHEQGLISVLRQIHDDLDAAVFQAYSWPSTLSDEEILARLVALNAERAAEEARGLVRWLRPEFQAPASRDVQKGLTLPEQEEAGEQAGIGTGGKKSAKKRAKQPWPKEQAERTKAIQAALSAASAPLTASELMQSFLRARADTVEEILDALVSLGLARRVRGGKYAVDRQ